MGEVEALRGVYPEERRAQSDIETAVFIRRSARDNWQGAERLLRLSPFGGVAIGDGVTHADLILEVRKRGGLRIEQVKITKVAPSASSQE